MDPTSDLKDSMAPFILTLEKAMKFKKVMVGKKLTIAKTKCWHADCGGMVTGRLYPNRRDRSGYHIHTSCDGTCKSVFME